jgi:hypothetical protein
VGSVSAVLANGKIFRLDLLELAQNSVCVNTGLKVLEYFSTLLVQHGALDTVVVSTLNHHSLVWNAGEFVVDLFIRVFVTL